MTPTQRILVVDDDSSGRRLTRATLAKAGFAVIEAANGRQALDQMAKGLPDLVLMDVSMPEMDGFTACSELRRLPGGTRVPVIMMTGLDDVGSIERAFEVGASDFITKPINWAILGHRVRYILRASHAIETLAQSQRRLSNAQRIGDMGDWEWDSRADRVLCSEQAQRIFGHGGDEARLAGVEAEVADGGVGAGVRGADPGAQDPHRQAEEAEVRAEFGEDRARDRPHAPPH